MATGRLPFQGSTDLLTFELVQAGKVVWPGNLPANTKDLIEKLLVKNPTERLGCNSFEELKAHAFFGGVNWATLSSTSPPVFKIADYELVWTTESQKREKLAIDEAQLRFKDQLRKKEKVVHAGHVHKLFRDESKKRLRIMVLTSKRRILYFNDKHELKGELLVPDSKDVTVEVGEGVFHLHLVRTA
jgi:serine/threonine protein kinase